MAYKPTIMIFMDTIQTHDDGTWQPGNHVTTSPPPRSAWSFWCKSIAFACNTGPMIKAIKSLYPNSLSLTIREGGCGWHKVLQIMHITSVKCDIKVRGWVAMGFSLTIMLREFGHQSLNYTVQHNNNCDWVWQRGLLTHLWFLSYLLSCD